MAVDIKVAPDEKLELVQTYITDTNPNSDYFVISELPDTFSGGKNAFLIAGSDKLLANTEVKVQVRDAAGNVCYIEFSNGLPTEYYEGNSKVVAVYVYPTLTSFGPATITILGQLKDVPTEWSGLYNVKWQKQVNINPALANTTRVRLYKRPLVTISEILEPLYSIVSGSKVASLVTQSFASIKVNQLETFAGDVARVKVYRTSAGDIADYELIQDISIEAKNLLTTYALTGSVVGNAGIFGPDSLSKVWNTGSLNAQLNSTYINDGLQLDGHGLLTYTSSLNLLSSNTYELELDTFFTGSTSTNLVAYISGTQNGAIPITTFSGSTPTKNFGTTTIPFTIPNDEPTASLYFSQSASEWHVGNISLNLSQDTAFSPNEVSFITSMPTVLGNETFNFKFELYDINNNYVPIAITQSALFTGGNNNVGGTLLLISGSTSASNAAILALSQSVSGTIGVVTGSVSYVSTSVSQSFYTSSVYSASLQSSSLYISSSISGTISNVSQSVSGTISFVSSSLSSSISSSISTSIAFASQSVYNSLSSSYAKVQQLADGGYSGSFISGNVMYAPVVGGQLGYFSSLFRVGQEPGSIYLDARTSTRKIYIGGVNSTGSYNSGSTPVYMDSAGNFSLGSGLLWDGSSLTVNGTINVTGGNAATQAYASSSAFTQANTAYTNAVSTASGSSYTMATTSANSAYTNASASAYTMATVSSNTAYNNAKSVADSIANGTYSGGTLITGTSIVSPTIAGANGYFSQTFKVGNGGITLDGVNKLIYVGAGHFNNADTSFYVDNSSNFSLGNKLSWDGSTLTVSGTINANAGTFSGNITSTATISGGTISGGTISGGSISIGSNFSVDVGGNMVANNANIAGAITAGNGSTIGGWTISNSQIYVPNAINLDAIAKQISVADASGVPRVVLNQNASLSSLTGGGGSSGGYGGGSGTSGTSFSSTVTSFTANSGQTYVVSANINQSDAAYAITLNTFGYYSGYYSTFIYITNGSTTYTLFSFSHSISQKNSTYSALGGINGKSGTLSFTGDGTTWSITTYTYYSGPNTIDYSNYGLSSPSFNYSYAVDVSKTEIIPGGLQVVTTSTQYVQAPRTAGTALIVGGNITATGTITPGVSDGRLKENIVNIDKPLDKINNINGVYFNYTDEANVFVPHLGKNRQVGVIAQEINSVFEEIPELTPISPFDNDGQGNSKTGQNYMTVQYEKLVPLLIEGIKELSKKVSSLEAQLSGSK